MNDYRDDEEEINLVDLFHYILKRWKLMLLVAVILSVVACIYGVLKNTGSIKNIAIGFILGIFLVCVFYGVKYLLLKTIRNVEEFWTVYHQIVFGNVIESEKIESDEIVRAATEIRLKAQQMNVSNIMITSSLMSEDVTKVRTMLTEELTKQNVKTMNMESLVTNLTTLEKVPSVQGVVFVEKAMETLNASMEKELELCGRYNVPVIGVVAIKE